MKKFLKKIRKIKFYLLVVLIATSFASAQSTSNDAKEIIYGDNNDAGKYIKVNGINIYYESYGRGIPLILLHGNGGSIGGFTPQLPVLSSKYHVIAFDTRYHGKSGDDGTELTYELMADDISKALRQLNIDSAYIWGFSDGAILGLLLAIHHPEQVKKLVAYGANLVPDTSAVIPSIYLALEKQNAKVEDPRQKRLNRLMDLHPHIPVSDLKKIKAEVLVMMGDRDFFRIEHTGLIFNSIEKSNLCILPGCTHAGPWEKKDLFLSVIMNFFDNPFSKPNTEDWFKDPE